MNWRLAAAVAADRERKSEEAEARLRPIHDLIAQCAIPTLIVDAHGIIRYANLAAESLFQRRADELLNRPFGIPVAAGDGVRINIVRKDGQDVVAEMAVKETRWNDGTAHITSFHDVTRRTDAERALIQAKQQAELANETKSQFLANISHELRTPLNSILGFAELLQMELWGPLGHEKYQEYIADVRQSGLHLLSLINDLLDLSKAEAGQLALHEEEFEVIDATHTAVHSIEPHAAAKRLEIVVDFAPREIFVRADRVKFIQIALNLLSNAVKFTPDGGEIRIGGGTDAAGNLLFEVSDTGIGIPEADLSKAFAAFVQVENVYSRTERNGTGLGLALCKKLVELHGGRISLASTEGVGTTITVVLPADRVLDNSCGVVPLAQFLRPAREARPRLA